MKEIKTVGVIGLGVMGAAIGINAAEVGYKVIYKELNDDLANTLYQDHVVKPLNKKVLKNKLKKDKMNEILSHIDCTSNNEDLRQCDLIIEAAVEKLSLKKQLFKEIDSICSKETILVSNTSTFKIEDLMDGVSSPSRTAGLHYFFPANINKLVEVISSKYTSKETLTSLMDFVSCNNKISILVEDFPGFAINPVFISSYMVLDSFYGTKCNVSTLEEISKQALGIKFGIMWIQNASGIATCYHAAKSMTDYLYKTDISYPKLPIQLEKQAAGNTLWDLKDGEISNDLALFDVVKERLLGAIFTISAHLIEKEIVSISDLELGICTALAWPKGPFTMMNDLGMKKVSYLIEQSVKNKDFRMPNRFEGTIPDKWEL